jgi:hypothetical protein
MYVEIGREAGVLVVVFPVGIDDDKSGRGVYLSRHDGCC